MERKIPWDDYAQSYTEKMDRNEYYWPRDDVIEAVLKFASNHLNGQRVIDVACGFGYLSRMLSEHGATVTAVDSSEMMIEIANTKSSGSSVGYSVADSAEVPFDSGTFDTLVCNMALQDIENVEGTIREMVRLGTNGAIFVLSIRHPYTDGWEANYARQEAIDNPLPSAEEGDRRNYPPRYHRPLSYYLNTIVGEGISIHRSDEIVDPKGSPFAVVIKGRAT